MTVLVVAPIEVVTKIVVVRVESVVDRSLPIGTSPFAGVHRLNLVCIERGCHAGIEVDLDLAILTFLGGNDNHTVGST